MKKKFKLISMVEFVHMLRSRTRSELHIDFPNAFGKRMVHKDQSREQLQIDILSIESIQWRLTGEYMKLLSRKQKLGMFFPCDLDDNLLEEPLDWKNPNSALHKPEAARKYEEAKDRVLFQHNFHIANVTRWLECETVEFLVDAGEVYLTPTALKEIGL